MMPMIAQERENTHTTRCKCQVGCHSQLLAPVKISQQFVNIHWCPLPGLLQTEFSDKIRYSALPQITNTWSICDSVAARQYIWQPYCQPARSCCAQVTSRGTDFAPTWLRSRGQESTATNRHPLNKQLIFYTSLSVIKTHQFCSQSNCSVDENSTCLDSYPCLSN